MASECAAAQQEDGGLVRLRDLAGRERGTAFAVDTDGTLVTSHEAVDGLTRLVAVPLGAGGRAFLAEAGDIVPLPEWDLALVRTRGLGVAPLVVGGERAHPAGTAVRLPLGCPGWLEVPVAGLAQVTYTATDRFHALEDVLELEMPPAAAAELRLSTRLSGAPVVAGTGAVLAVLGTALHAPHRAAGFAVPLRAAALPDPDGPLGALLARNGAALPAYGPDLNLAGALRLTAATSPRAEGGVRTTGGGAPVERPETRDALRAFATSGASVAALVGSPGTGRTTELAALTRRRGHGSAPAPTVWLRGADLRPGDGGVRDAVGRALAEAARAVTGGGTSAPCPDVVARLARDAGRPLLVVLDGPEEMPPALAAEAARWTAGTASWLRAAGARMLLGCGPEYWEEAGARYPAGLLYGHETGVALGSGAFLPPCIRLGPPTPEQAARLRARHGLPEGALAAADAGHPLAVRMLAQVRAAQVPGQGAPGEASPHAHAGAGAPPTRADVFSAHLDLVSLRIAERLAHAGGRASAGTVRRRAARVAGQLHEAARRCLGSGHGALDGGVFAELFPRAGGWAAAVLAEGVLVRAGEGYRFGDEEFADWLQGRHLDAAGALDTLVHRLDGADGPAGPDGADPAWGVPRHRIGTVVQALLRCGRQEGPEALERHLLPLAAAYGTHGATGAPGTAATGTPRGREAAWWATHLLGETLLALPDARPYTRVLRTLAERIVAGGRSGEFGPWFWRRLALPADERVALLGLLLPADAPYRAHAPDAPDGAHGAHGARDVHAARADRYLDVVADLLVAEPRAVQPLLCGWFADERPLQRRTDVPTPGTPTVASAAQALLHTHRGRALDALADVLAAAPHPRARELLADLAHDEPGALCRAVARWAHDRREERRAAAAAHAARAERYARTDTDRALLKRAALALLRRPAEQSLHGPALALLVRLPATRAQYLDAALAHVAATGAPEPAAALAVAAADDPSPVLAAFAARLREPGSGARAVLAALARVRTPALAPRITALVREYTALRPETAGEPVAAFVRHKLGQGRDSRVVLQPLVGALLRTPYAPLRASLAGALGEGASAGRLRAELLDALLEAEREPLVLDAALDAVVRRGSYGGTAGGDMAAGGPGSGGAGGEPDLVRRIGALMCRTPDGAACCDRRLVELAREVPGFVSTLRALAAYAPGEWPAAAGPGVRRLCDTLADLP